MKHPARDAPQIAEDRPEAFPGGGDDVIERALGVVDARPERALVGAHLDLERLDLVAQLGGISPGRSS